MIETSPEIKDLALYKRRMLAPGGRLSFAVIGDAGAVEFWLTPTPEYSKKQFGDNYYGGIETHWRHCPDHSGYFKSDDPSQTLCDLLNAPCWHDGTSSWASEHWIPLFESMGEGDWIWQKLEEQYRGQFGGAS